MLWFTLLGAPIDEGVLVRENIFYYCEAVLTLYGLLFWKQKKYF